jgi:hypothetical protein
MITPSVHNPDIDDRRGSAVSKSNIPESHSDPWINLPLGYIASLNQALSGQGVQIDRSWLDPFDPRDATIIHMTADERHALVWDEETGWRTGRYLSGRQGVRTELADAVYLGGGVLVDPREIAARLLTSTRAPRSAFRSYTDTRDGLDDALRQYAG